MSIIQYIAKFKIERLFKKLGLLFTKYQGYIT